MASVGSLRSWRMFVFVLSCSFPAFIATVYAQGAKQSVPRNPIADSDGDHVQERNAWFYRGRLVRGKPSAELRRQAYQTKLRMRSRRATALSQVASGNGQPAAAPSGSWIPLGPAPLASDATGNHTQDYGFVAGRATAVAIDPADATGATVYIGGAQSGIWRSTNAANADPTTVAWSPVSDDQATLSIGAIAIQPGNTDLTKTVILAATGEADNSGDSYFGLGILRSADAGGTWSLLSTANNGALSFSGLGGTRMAFSTASPMNTVVAAMATTSEGVVDGAVTASTKRGLYTSLDAGQTWNYNTLVDPGGATDPTSATSVAYNAAAGLFFAAVRYHGLYSSPDGVTWTRLTNQPGATSLGAGACPPQSNSNNYACPIYRAELTVVPGRNEMYAWLVYFASNGELADGGIWQTLNGGATWTHISDSGITNCGDDYGCGVQQGFYNLELLAVPSGAATDLYAGAVNLYKCSITIQNPTCLTSPFLNLSHVYGCDPIGAPAHVHPDQHALAYAIPSGTNNALLYFANDGGIYRALNGFAGLNSGSCATSNQFDDLNANLGSMTQFVSFSQHPSDPNTLLGGTQDNGSPATASATTSQAWGNVLGGDGGYNAIDPNATSNFYASNPDISPGGLAVQLCTSGVNCTDGTFNVVVSSASLAGDDGAFYFPFVLDWQSPTAMLIGTCRVWRGPRAGGGFTALSPNFDTLGSGSCSGSEVNQVRSLAAGGPADGNGSKVIYATTGGMGPANSASNAPVGGQIWVTTNASAGTSNFVDVTDNGPQGDINPNQFPISGAAMDSSDATGKTAYVTVMGFTGGSGHIWKTANAGISWIDFTGNLPDSPANAVVVYPAINQVFVATDVGVFESSTGSPDWTEVGPKPALDASGYLPNVAVTALAIFSSGTQQWLRASTYGRGIWQFNLASAPDFQVSLSNSPQSVTAGNSASFVGTASALNGFSGTVTLSCVAGATPAPASCSSPQSPLTPGIGTSFSVNAAGSVGDYYFSIRGIASDASQTMHVVSAVLHVLGNFGVSESGSFPTINAGATGSGSISVTAINGFTGAISLSCSVTPGTGTCSVSPATVTSMPATPLVTVNAGNLSAGSYQLTVIGISGSESHTLVISFDVGDFQLSGPSSLVLAATTQGTATVTVTSLDNYQGNVTSSCSVSQAVASCNTGSSSASISPGSSASVVATISTLNAPAGTYNATINVQDTSGTPSHSFSFPLVVQDFRLTLSSTSQTVNAGGTTALNIVNVQPSGSAFDSAVTFSCAGVPGAQCVFSPGSVTPGSIPAQVGMTIGTSPNTSVGTYTVTVTGTSGALSRSTSLQLIVTSIVVNNNDFQLAVTQSFQSGPAGSQRQAKVSLTANYASTVTAACDASQCAIAPSNPIPISANTSITLTLSLNVPSTMSPGSYNVNLTVADSSGQPSHAIQIPLAVVQDFSVTSATPSQTIAAGQTTTGGYQLTVGPNPQGSSFSGTVSLACSGLPAGAQCSFAPASAVTLAGGPAAVVMNISLAKSAAVFPRAEWYVLGLLIPGIVIGWSTSAGTGGARRKSLCLVFLFILVLSLLSCGGVSTSGSGNSSSGGRQPLTYQVTIIGASPGTTADSGQSTEVTLVID